MPKISVVCVTNREGAHTFLLEQLQKQTFKDFEVIVADDYAGEISSQVNWFKPRAKLPGDAWNLNKAYNDCLDKVKGELIVFLQDFIWIPANGLERFWELHELFPDDLISGCGHKALNGIEGISEIDERVFGEGVTPGNYSHYELNWASAPAKIGIRFNEEMDKNYGGENHYYAQEAIKKGSRIYIDHENRCIGLSQEFCGGRPHDWEERHYNKLK